MGSGEEDRDKGSSQSSDDARAESDIMVEVDAAFGRRLPRPGSWPRASLTDDQRLARIFGDPVPVDEVRIWAGIPPSRRDKVLQRVAALDRYCGGEKGLTAKQAAVDAGVELGRFYQLARLWAAGRSLAHLGTYASATQQRQRFKPEVVNALQAVVARVVTDNPKAPVTRLAQLLADASGLPPDKVPKKNTLRTFVEREQRRLRAAQQAGTEALFDCSAISLSRKDGGLQTVFLVIDSGTGLIFGHAVGDATASAAGYRLAAQNAWERIRGGLLPAGIWAPSLERSQMVPGSDADVVKRMAAAVAAEVGGVAPQLTRAGDHGRYMRDHLGAKLGPIQLLPRRTSNAEGASGSPGGEALTPGDADARVEVAVVMHNDEVLAKTATDGEPAAPEGLVRLLEAIAGG